jgi:EAL domain-containing protein (putative c-di-GMP-specific phosphodiesterase class I)
VEALLRMSETGGELILPMSFIPVAERYDLMRTIDRWVIERAFADYRRLAKLRDQPQPAEFSINLSGHTLSSPTSPSSCRRSSRVRRAAELPLLRDHRDGGHRQRGARPHAHRGACAPWACASYLDDFGSGLSSFNYLKHFPVDGIKIDGLFVKGIAKNYLDYALVESIQRIGVALGLQTVAEYVESEEIARKLIQIGVTQRPGLLSVPAPHWENTSHSVRLYFAFRKTNDKTRHPCVPPRSMPRRPSPQRLSQSVPTGTPRPARTRSSSARAANGITTGRRRSPGQPRAQKKGGGKKRLGRQKAANTPSAVAMKAYQKGERDSQNEGAPWWPTSRTRTWKTSRLLRGRTVQHAERRNEDPLRRLRAPPRRLAPRLRRFREPRWARRSPRHAGLPRPGSVIPTRFSPTRGPVSH